MIKPFSSRLFKSDRIVTSETPSVFDSADTAENRAFKQRIADWLPKGRKVSNVFASAYTAARLCIEAIEAGGSEEPQRVRETVLSRRWQTLLGTLDVDPATNHAALPFLLGRINAERGFDVIVSRSALAADPYLTASAARPVPKLRIVS